MAEPRPRHLRTARALRRVVLPLLLAGTVVAVGAAAAGGATLLRVAGFAVLLLGVAAALASDADARAERREHAAERARLAAAFTDAHARLVRAHADSADEATARYAARVRRLRDHLATSNARLATTRGELAASRAELDGLRADLAGVREQLDRMTRSRDALRADVAASVALETDRLAREAGDERARHEQVRLDHVGSEDAPVGDVVELGSWERRAAG